MEAEEERSVFCSTAWCSTSRTRASRGRTSTGISSETSSPAPSEPLSDKAVVPTLSTSKHPTEMEFLPPSLSVGASHTAVEQSSRRRHVCISRVPLSVCAVRVTSCVSRVPPSSFPTLVAVPLFPSCLAAQGLGEERFSGRGGARHSQGQASVLGLECKVSLVGLFGPGRILAYSRKVCVSG